MAYLPGHLLRFCYEATSKFLLFSCCLLVWNEWRSAAVLFTCCVPPLIPRPHWAAFPSCNQNLILHVACWLRPIEVFKDQIKPQHCAGMAGWSRVLKLQPRQIGTLWTSSNSATPWMLSRVMLSWIVFFIDPCWPMSLMLRIQHQIGWMCTT
jgi:hypothetical protein